MIPAGSTADRGQAALIIVDMQQRLAAAMEHRDRVVARAVFLVRVAELTGMPVIVTRQYPQGLGDLQPELDDVLREAQSAGARVYRADKLTFDCFGEPGFVDAVTDAGRRQLVVTGMETHICVVQTALTALSQGFDVHVVSDACCSREMLSWSSALDRLCSAGAVVTTAESVAYEVVGRAGTDEFKRLLTAVKALG